MTSVMRQIIFLLLLLSSAHADVFHGTGADVVPTEASIPYLAEKGITTVRLQIHIDPSGVRHWGPHQYFMANHDWFTWLDHLIPIYKQHNIRIILNMAYPPGGFDSKRRMPMFNPNHWGNNYFVDMWKFIANKYKDEDTILGFDLINEPHNSASDVHRLQERATQAIREVSDKVIFHTSRRGRCIDFKTLRRSVYGNVKYTCHVYEPWGFTHIGTPNHYKTKAYKKSALVKELAPVRRWATRYGPESVYIGEGAVSIHADPKSHKQWLEDLLDMTRDYNWTYYFVTGHWWRYNVWEPSHEIWMQIYQEFK